MQVEYSNFTPVYILLRKQTQFDLRCNYLKASRIA